MTSSIDELRSRTRTVHIRWGFIWAFATAVLWAAWYIPGEAIYTLSPFVEMPSSGSRYVLAALVVTILNAIAVLLALILWNAVLGKTREIERTLARFRVSWYFIPAGLAGMLAILGTVTAIAYIGAGFAAVAALLYPIVGAFAAKVWYNESMTKRSVLGILVIVSGGIVIFAPGIIAEVAGSDVGGWMGYLGGFLAIFGWGMEGAIVGRALDVSDSDVGLVLRFIVEVLIWLAIVVPITSITVGDEFWALLGEALSSGRIALILVLLGLTFGFCYACWYKSFPLIGVGRGQAIAALNGPLALLWLFMFTLEPPGLQFVVGGTVVVAGCFVLFAEGRRALEIVRAVPVEAVRPGQESS